jgi:hypothetical protein
MNFLCTSPDWRTSLPGLIVNKSQERNRALLTEEQYRYESVDIGWPNRHISKVCM